MPSYEFDPVAGLYPKQKEILLSIYENSKVSSTNVLLASRQAGKTYLLCHLAAMFALNKKKQTILFISPSWTQSIKIFNQLVGKIHKILIKKTIKSNDDRKIVLVNDSEILFRSAANYDSLRGLSVDCCIIDECAFISDIAWETVIQATTMAKRYCNVIMASTPRGKQGIFYKTYEKCLSTKRPHFHLYTMHYTDNPDYNLEKIQELKEELPSFVFDSEYEARFIDSHSEVFNNFSRCLTLNEWLTNSERNKSKYYAGIDWSGSGDDSTVLTIIDDLNRVVLIYEVQAERMKDQIIEILQILKQYPDCITYSEINGLGKSATEELQERFSNVYEFVSSNESKQNLVSITNLAMSNDALDLPTPSLCPKLNQQLSSYVVKRSQTGKLVYGSTNIHDDFVMSLMISLKAKSDNSNNKMTFVNPNQILSDRVIIEEKQVNEINNINTEINTVIKNTDDDYNNKEDDYFFFTDYSRFY